MIPTEQGHVGGVSLLPKPASSRKNMTVIQPGSQFQRTARLKAGLRTFRSAEILKKNFPVFLIFPYNLIKAENEK
ncbi:MAG: hypothetical protein BWK80_44640 [Desulfobacteraceae bacterium IS3]|nr:MAG: hypothetical protein BWK80_44640 [Desulfobacteraceae bacterium IS3]